MTNWDNIVTGKELEKTSRSRKAEFYEQKNFTSAKADLESEGWLAASTYANPKYTKYRKA